jgi:hypothetical protein
MAEEAMAAEDAMGGDVEEETMAEEDAMAEEAMAAEDAMGGDVEEETMAEGATERLAQIRDNQLFADLSAEAQKALALLPAGLLDLTAEDRTKLVCGPVTGCKWPGKGVDELLTSWWPGPTKIGEISGSLDHLAFYQAMVVPHLYYPADKDGNSDPLPTSWLNGLTGFDRKFHIERIKRYQTMLADFANPQVTQAIADVDLRNVVHLASFNIQGGVMSRNVHFGSKELDPETELIDANEARRLFGRVYRLFADSFKGPVDPHGTFGKKAWGGQPGLYVLALLTIEPSKTDEPRKLTLHETYSGAAGSTSVTERQERRVSASNRADYNQAHKNARAAGGVGTLIENVVRELECAKDPEKLSAAMKALYGSQSKGLDLATIDRAVALRASQATAAGNKFVVLCLPIAADSVVLTTLTPGFVVKDDSPETPKSYSSLLLAAGEARLIFLARLINAPNLNILAMQWGSRHVLNFGVQSRTIDAKIVAQLTDDSLTLDTTARQLATMIAETGSDHIAGLLEELLACGTDLRDPLRCYLEHVFRLHSNGMPAGGWEANRTMFRRTDKATDRSGTLKQVPPARSHGTASKLFPLGVLALVIEQTPPKFCWDLSVVQQFQVQAVQTSHLINSGHTLDGCPFCAGSFDLVGGGGENDLTSHFERVEVARELLKRAIDGLKQNPPTAFQSTIALSGLYQTLLAEAGADAKATLYSLIDLHSLIALGEPNKPGRRKKSEPKQIELFCSCRKEEGTGPMVGCDECGVWFHLACIDLTLEDVNGLASYICEACSTSTSNNKSISPCW